MKIKLSNRSQLNEDTLTRILQQHFEDDSISLSNISDNLTFLQENDNFNSEVKKWTFKVHRENNGGDFDISVIAKSSPTTLFQRKMSTIARAFSHEVYWFNHAFPTLKKLCPEISDLSPISYYAYSNYTNSLMGRKVFGEKICCMPCYPIFLEEEKGLILMEDLCARELPLTLMPKTDILSFEQAKTVFISLAKFHGAWLKWRHMTKNESGSMKLEHLDSFEFSIKPWMLKAMSAKTGEMVSLLLKNQSVDEEIIHKWQNYVKVKLVRDGLKYFDIQAEEKVSKIITMAHGDMWSNNLLFSSDFRNVVFIDFQMLTLSHPARDLWYLLTVNTDEEFRSSYLDDLLKIYFDVFNQYLVDAQITLTFNEFSKEFYQRRHFAFALGLQLQIMPNVLSPNPIEFKGLNPMKKVYEKQKQELAGVPSSEDHPTIVEIRRRIVQLVLEATKCDFF